MTQRSGQFSKEGRRRRWRKRAASCFSGSRGRTIGLSSLAAPIAGFIVNDLRKPDSIIRRLVGVTVARIRSSSKKRTKKLDIGDQVEVIIHDDDEHT